MKKNKIPVKELLKKTSLWSVAFVAITTVAVAIVVSSIHKNNSDISVDSKAPLETNKGSVIPDVSTDTKPAVTEPPVTEPPVTEPPVTEPPVTEPPVTEPPVTEPPVTEPPVTEPPVTEPPVTEPPVTEPPVTEPPVTEPPVTEPPVVIPPAPEEHPFDNALFIGDSRTDGLNTYADLGNADVFASRGMNVYRLFKDSIEVDGEEITLEEMLAAKKYDRVYIMLGINEIGYPADSVIKKYTEAVNKVREAQPDAIIYLQANLHITTERSNSDAVYNNTNLNLLNSRMASLADGNKTLFIDCNPVFDDEKGGLKKEYAFDDFHLLGRYYSIWADWIAKNS